MGVTFFDEEAPNAFGKFDRAFITMYRLTAGETWVRPTDACAEGRETGNAMTPGMR